MNFIIPELNLRNPIFLSSGRFFARLLQVGNHSTAFIGKHGVWEN
jgi:hypothetical protein